MAPGSESSACVPTGIGKVTRAGTAKVAPGGPKVKTGVTAPAGAEAGDCSIVTAVLAASAPAGIESD